MKLRYENLNLSKKHLYFLVDLVEIFDLRFLLWKKFYFFHRLVKNKGKLSAAFAQLLASCTLCNSATYESDDTMDKSGKRFTGNSLDVSLLEFVNEWDSELNDALATGKYTLLDELAFSSERKWMMRVFRTKDNLLVDEATITSENGADLMIVKGAPDILIGKIGFVLEADGKRRRPIDAHQAQQIVDLNNEWCLLGQRVLAVCTTVCDDYEQQQQQQQQPDDILESCEPLCLIGLVGLVDPPRLVLIL